MTNTTRIGSLLRKQWSRPALSSCRCHSDRIRWLSGRQLRYCEQAGILWLGGARLSYPDLSEPLW